MSQESSIGKIGIGIVIFGAAVLGLMCTNRIAPGYAGVVYNMDGGVEDTVLPQGYHLTAPWKKIIEYPISTETVYYTKSQDGKDDDDDKSDNSINVNTKDGKQVNVSVTYAFHMDPNNLPAVFTKFRDSLSPFGVIIETFNLSDVVPDEQTKEAIQKVVNAQNVLEQAKIEKQTAEVEAEKARIDAKGKADAAIIEAEGQSQANAKLQQSLSDNVIRQHAIEKWNGELPKYQLSDKTGALINVN